MRVANVWRIGSAAACLAAVATSAIAQEQPPVPPADAAAVPSAEAAVAPSATTRNGLEIYRTFREGLAQPECDADATSQRWRQHFAHVPKRLAAGDDDVLPLFGYVVDALRQSHVPTEFALIPFVESGYRPGARSAAGSDTGVRK